MRIQLSGLFRRVLLKEGRAIESLRARRQANRQHQQFAAPGAGQFAGLAGRQGAGDPDGCRCYGCALRRAGPLARSLR